MFPDIWTAVAGRSFATVEGTAAGYAIFRVRDAVFPGIVVASGSSVRGVVYLDVDLAAVDRLDRFEDDFYDRQSLTIDCDDGRQLVAGAYVVPPASRHVLTSEPWDLDSFVASGGLERFISRFAGFGRIASSD